MVVPSSRPEVAGAAAWARSVAVVVFSAAQLYRSPSLGRSLRHVIADMTDEQTQTSREICEQHGVRFLDMTHEDVHADRDDSYLSSRRPGSDAD